MQTEERDQEDVAVTALLARARARVDPVLRAAVDTLPARMRLIAGYHLGWWDQGGVLQEGGSGKAIRPALVLATLQAAKADDDRGLCAAAAVELVHNFTLLHDDVMDADTLRRHRPTAWAVFGLPDAILAGDALQALAARLLAHDPHPAASAAASRLASCVIELCEGQHADCAFQERTTVGLDGCLTMSEAKTGALLGCACALGALYAGADEKDADSLDRCGRQLGLCFQLVDDLLGIWGDPAVTGKPAGADLVALKKSLPVTAALASGTAAGDELAALFEAGAPLRPAQLPHAMDLVERAGGRRWARAQADETAGQALEGLSRMYPEPQARGELLALARLISRRDH
ncbi:family 2 encapsulin nanocompartment cargo protein polyprenyl transferase [Streptomyces sp. NBC_01304]|uniref:family 2 encapsulin nanocompartment cargo protein polyprenyl transferase n=1 Tax=Streptomyces sp. NBC_01304 TaxID=2903818 RepID=UPI002E0ECA3D|nr:family 2 encapsulin nanocompartment cargo protein polyprenyl transferase [Streptomyces sp. NBC_01304]